MKNPLNKSLKKEFTDNLARYLALALVMIVMIATVSGFFSVAYSVNNLLKQNQDECLVEDGQFTVLKPLTKEVIKEIEKEPVKLYENFYSEQKIKNSATLRIYQDRENINLVTVYQGKLPKKHQEIALDRLFAIKNGYKINDQIKVNGIKLTIVGYLSLPDYSSLIKDNSDLMMDPIHFGVAIVDESDFALLKENNINYTYSYKSNDDLSSKENYDQLNQIRDIVVDSGCSLTGMMTQEMNQAISFLPNDMGGDIPMMNMLFYIILVILAFIFVVISQAIIEDQATAIGTLLANGYTKQELIHHYLTLVMIIVFVSGLVGNVIGYTIMPSFFSNMYYNSYCLPPLQLKFIPSVFVNTTVIPFLVILIVNYLMLWHKLNISPLKFLRQDLHENKKSHYINLKQTSFIKRYRQRVILQNKGSYLVLMIGIIFASFLLTFGFCITPSIERYLENMENSIKTNYQYLLKVPVEAAGEKITYTLLQTYFAAGEIDLDVSFYGLDDNSIYYADIDLPKEKDQIIISYDFAKKVGLEKGDKVTFTNQYTEQEYQLKVFDIYNSRTNISVYMSRESLNNLLEEDLNYYNSYLSDQKLNIDKKYLSTMITKTDMLKIGDQMTETFSQMIPIMSGIAIVIYLVVMYILTKLVLDRNTNYMSFLKVIGYNSQEIAKIYLKATALVVVFSLLISLPICKYGLEILFIQAMMRFAGYIEIYIPTYLYVMIFTVGLITYFVVNWLLNKQIQRIDLGKSLKETE